ncbi:MAG: hypothetical protein Q8Q09_12915 [Deltaproteobacteria bacterium]|nr:hypothetical protein [Deltaproteobacteria bacterium]
MLKSRPLAALLALACAACGPVTYRSPLDASTDAPSVPVRVLTFDQQAPLQMQPGDRALIVVSVRSAASGQPDPEASVRFSLLGQSEDATLSSTRATSTLQSDGTATASVTLVAPSLSAEFIVRAQTDDNAVVTRSVTVSDRGYGSIVARPRYNGVRGASSFAIQVFRGGRCEAITGNAPLRTMTIAVQAGASARFDSLIANSAYTVVVEALGPSGVAVGRGCVEQSNVQQDTTVDVPVNVVDLPLNFAGSYRLTARLSLDAIAGSAEALWLEAAISPASEIADLLQSIATDVERTSGATARASFEAQAPMIATRLETSLRARNSLPSQTLARWARTIGASFRSSTWEVLFASQIVNDRPSLRIESSAITLDPQTPAIEGDDLTRPIAPSGSARAVIESGDRATLIFENAALPLSLIATTARDAQLARLSHTSTEALLLDELRCDLVASETRSVTARCDNTCIVEACTRQARRWSARFDRALGESVESLNVVTASARGPASGVLGSTTVQSIGPVRMSGAFVDDPSRVLEATATISRR